MVDATSPIHAREWRSRAASCEEAVAGTHCRLAWNAVVARSRPGAARPLLAQTSVPAGASVDYSVSRKGVADRMTGRPGSPAFSRRRGGVNRGRRRPLPARVVGLRAGGLWRSSRRRECRADRRVTAGVAALAVRRDACRLCPDLRRHPYECITPATCRWRAATELGKRRDVLRFSPGHPWCHGVFAQRQGGLKGRSSGLGAPRAGANAPRDLHPRSVRHRVGLSIEGAVSPCERSPLGYSSFPVGRRYGGTRHQPPARCVGVRRVDASRLWCRISAGWAA